MQDGPGRLFRAVVVAGAALASGCYLSHEREETARSDASRLDAGRDAGSDAGTIARRDAGRCAPTCGHCDTSAPDCVDCDPICIL